MNLQTVAQTSGNNWHPSYSFQRAYERNQPRSHTVPREVPHHGLTFFAGVEKEMAEYKRSQEAMMKEVQNRFGMALDALVASFLANHRSLPHLLAEAFDRLQQAFGTRVVVNLEVSTDEDGYQTLYAIVLWRGDAHHAEAAFNSFVENWWIHRMNAPTADIAFVYQLI